MQVTFIFSAVKKFFTKRRAEFTIMSILIALAIVSGYLEFKSALAVKYCAQGIMPGACESIVPYVPNDTLHEVSWPMAYFLAAPAFVYLAVPLGIFFDGIFGMPDGNNMAIFYLMVGIYYAIILLVGLVYLYILSKIIIYLIRKYYPRRIHRKEDLK